MSEYRLSLTEKPNLDAVGIEPLIDMAFAADLVGMTYEQIRGFLSRNKWRFPPRYRVVHYKDVGGYRRVTKIRVLYPYEVKLIREITLRGPGSTIHNRTDLNLYLSSEEGQNTRERLRKPSVSERAAKTRITRESGVHAGGTAKVIGSDSGTTLESSESQANQDSLSSRGDDQSSTYD